MQWRVLSSKTPQTLEELKHILLENRGITDVDTFLHPPHPSIITPESVGISLEQLGVALARLEQAYIKQEDVVILGDYDADGVCATTVLWQTLHALGFKVRPFLPIREKHGYGLSHRVLDDILSDQKPNLIITVDNGIVALEPAVRLQKAGVDLIITDHHQPEVNEAGEHFFPASLAVVHTTQLCGTTVSWMFSRSVLQHFAKRNPIAEKLLANPNYQLDLCALATVADQVPLVGANRSFAKHGLGALANTKRPGLLALYEQAALNPAETTTQTIGFTLAPRINAMGRLGHSMDALRLLCTTSQQKARSLAEVLGQTNLTRQELTSRLFEEAVAQAEQQQDEHVVIVHSPDYHEGVIGLIAGRLMERYYKPAIAISVGDTIAKASARSVPGVNIVELIREVRADLLEVGGHPMAAGFGLDSGKLDGVQKKLFSLAKEKIVAELLEPRLNTEVEIPSSFISLELVEAITSLEPFGQGNQLPILALTEVELKDVVVIGKNQEHLKFVLGLTNNSSTPQLEGLQWRNGHKSADYSPNTQVKIAGVLEKNTWKNRTKLQLIVKDVQPM